MLIDRKYNVTPRSPYTIKIVWVYSDHYIYILLTFITSVNGDDSSILSPSTAYIWIVIAHFGDAPKNNVMEHGSLTDMMKLSVTRYINVYNWAKYDILTR